MYGVEWICTKGGVVNLDIVCEVLRPGGGREENRVERVPLVQIIRLSTSLMREAPGLCLSTPDCTASNPSNDAFSAYDIRYEIKTAAFYLGFHGLFILHTVPCFPFFVSSRSSAAAMRLHFDNSGRLTRGLLEMARPPRRTLLGKRGLYCIVVRCAQLREFVSSLFQPHQTHFHRSFCNASTPRKARRVPSCVFVTKP